MPGHVHEGLKDLLAERPDLLLRLLTIASRLNSMTTAAPVRMFS